MYERAIELNSNDCSLCYLNKYEQAIQCFSAAVELKSDDLQFFALMTIEIHVWQQLKNFSS